MTRPLISVVIATYHNPPRYSDREFVDAAVSSVHDQTHQPIEVVVVDASPDVRNHTKRNSPGRNEIYWPLHHDADVCEALQAGVQVSGGNWLVLMNADDQLAPHFAESALAAMIDQHDRWNSYGAFDEAKERYVGVVVVSQQPLSAAVERDNYIPYLAMFARWFWDEMGGFVDVLGEGGACRLADWDLWIRIWQRYGDRAPVAYITDPSVIRLRDRPDSASKWSSDEFEALRARLWKARRIEP